MNFTEYQNLAERTMNYALTDDQWESHALHGIASEVGEIHSIYQKFYQGHPLDRSHVKSEIGDLLWFVSELCTANGWILDDIAQANIDKLKKRYPEGFDAEKSLHREKGDI